MPVQNDSALLSRLRHQGFEFVVIGGVCAVLHGVPLVTFDLDICCSFEFRNLLRLHEALKDLHPVHRMTPQRLPFQLKEDLGERLRNLYLQTDLGSLDCLSEVKGLGQYEDVRRRSITHRTSYGEFRVLELDALIVAKEALGRERDVAAVRLLRAIKEKNNPT